MHAEIANGAQALAAPLCFAHTYVVSLSPGMLPWIMQGRRLQSVSSSLTQQQEYGQHSHVSPAGPLPSSASKRTAAKARSYHPLVAQPPQQLHERLDLGRALPVLGPAVGLAARRLGAWGPCTHTERARSAADASKAHRFQARMHCLTCLLPWCISSRGTAPHIHTHSARRGLPRLQLKRAAGTPTMCQP